MIIVVEFFCIYCYIFKQNSNYALLIFKKIFQSFLDDSLLMFSDLHITVNWSSCDQSFKFSGCHLFI